MYFIHNQALWAENDLSQLLLKREIVLQAMENRHKDLDFLRQNRLIFMFQNNIIKDTKFTKYRKWFDFAEKTRNKKNSAKRSVIDPLWSADTEKQIRPRFLFYS